MTLNNKRLFFAVVLAPSTKHQIEEWREHSLAYLNQPIVKSDNLHITLAFLGQCNTQQIAALVDIGNKVSAEQFSLTFNQLHFWQKPKILCLAPSKVPSQLTELQQQLANRVAELGFESHHSQYKPHITLVRKIKHFTEARTSDVTFQINCTQFALYESHHEEVHGNHHKQKSGVVYTPLYTWDLL